MGRFGTIPLGQPACGRCGLKARKLESFTCPRCGADVRLVGLMPARSKDWIAPLAGFYCTLLVLVGGIIVAVGLDRAKVTRTHPAILDYWSALDRTSNTRIEVHRQVDEAANEGTGRFVLADPAAGRRSMLGFQFPGMRYSRSDAQLRMVRQPGVLDEAAIVRWMSDFGVDIQDQQTLEQAHDLMTLAIDTPDSVERSPFWRLSGSSGSTGTSHSSAPRWVFNVNVLACTVIWFGGLLAIGHLRRRSARWRGGV